MANKKLIGLMLILSIIGLLTATYQVYEHYFAEGDSSVCDYSENFSCSAVTGSRFGEFPQFSGIAVSLYGMLWFAAIIWLLYGTYRKKERFKQQDFYTFLFSGAGFLGVLYFLWAELIALPAETGELIICPFCTIQHVIIGLLLVMSFFALRKPVKEHLKNMFLEEVKK